MKVNFRKGIFSILTAGSIVLGTCAGTIAFADFTSRNDTVIATDDINMRTDDYVEADRIGGIEINSVAERVLTTSNGWDLIRYNDHLGFVSGDFTKQYSEPNPLYSYEELSTSGTTLDGVNLRLGPSVDDYDIITTLAAGTTVDVLGKSNNGWYLVRTSNNDIGFLRGDFLRINTYDVKSDYSLTNHIPTTIPVVQALQNAKIRSQASQESRQLDLLRAGNTIKMIQLLPNGWYEVEYKGQSAYIHSSLVRETIGVEGDFYKVVYLKRDSKLYDAPNGSQIDSITQYDCGEVYGESNGYLLISTDEHKTGFVKVEDTEVLTSTAVIVDISSQTLTVYSNNQIVLTAPIVSGLDNEERHSDIGIFKIYARELDRYLTDGETYNSHVNYWMPFNGGEGLHDATWRTRFGGEIYKTNGSHGCINMPLEHAKQLYDIVAVGDNVLVKR